MVDFPRRSALALSEVLRVEPATLCMGKLNHYEDFWHKALHKMGYDGVFIPKYDASYPRGFRSPPAYYAGQPTDGCALFVRRSKLSFQVSLLAMRRFGDLFSDRATTQVTIVAGIIRRPATFSSPSL